MERCEKTGRTRSRNCDCETCRRFQRETALRQLRKLAEIQRRITMRREAALRD